MRDNNVKAAEIGNTSIGADIPFRGRVTDIDTDMPLQDISVTDGKNVVKTDKDGKFLLEGYQHTRFITVTTPAGYTTDDYYIAVGERAGSYDFKLKKDDRTERRQHGFLQVSDTEIGVGGADNPDKWLAHVKKIARQTDAAFLIHTGDICYEAGLKRHKTVMNTENMGLPVRYVIGNHDYVAGEYGEALFESIYGPVWYSFEVGNVHYVVTPIQSGDYPSGYEEDERWCWLNNDLAQTAPDKKIVVFNHGSSPSDDYVFQAGEKALDLKRHSLLAWVFGHYHYHYAEEKNGVYNISTARPDTGGIDSSPSGTRHISVDEKGALSTQLFYFDMPEQIPNPENAVWSTQLSGRVLFTDTLLENGKIYTATADENTPHDCGIYCLSVENGAILWQLPTKNSVRNNLVYTDGKILAQDAEGRVLCVRADTGEVLWTTQVPILFSIGTNSAICADVCEGSSLSDAAVYACSSPSDAAVYAENAAESAEVYAGNSTDVTALRLTDGAKLWNYHRGQGENSPAGFVRVGNALIISPHWDALAALDVRDGSLLWENRDANVRFRTSTPAIVDENTILVVDDNAVMLLDARTGEIFHKTIFEGYRFASSGQAVIENGSAYIPTQTNGVIAFDLEAKTIRWEAVPGRALVYTAPYSMECATVEGTPLLTEGQLIFGASDGMLYRVDAMDGTILSVKKVGAPIFGKVTACEDGTVIVSDFAGRVSRIKL